MTVPFNLIDLLLFICLPSALTHLAPIVTVDNATTLPLTISINDSVAHLNGTVDLPEKIGISLDWMMVRLQS